MGVGVRTLTVLGAISLLAACSSYPREPRYSVHADGPAGPPLRAPVGPTYPTSPSPSGEGVRGPTDPAREVPPPRGAPVESIQGGELSSPGVARPYTDTPTRPYTEVPNEPARPYAEAPASPYAPPAGRPAAGPPSEGWTAPPPPARGPATAGAAYEIQAGDTISGIGRRFQTPVQTLIDLNGLGPRADISPGQRIILPQGAVDIGGDPYATGPSPFGAFAPDDSLPPPPPPPPISTAPCGR
ncbi:MAG: LysM peptidoglycan-binding domain-containing protein, partial [Brevundimonas sp.]